MPGILIHLEGPRWEFLLSDAEGRFRFKGLPRGRYKLRTKLTRSDDRVGVVLPVEAGDTDIVVELLSAHTLEARVLFPNGEPCPTGTARLGSIKGKVRNGELHLPGLPAGEYLLTLQVTDHLPLMLSVTLPSAPLVLQLDAGETIEVRVLHIGRKPVARVKVTAATEEEQDYRVGRTDGDGRIWFRGLHPGTYYLRVRARDDEGNSCSAGPLPVVAGSGPVTLRLRK